MGVAGTLRKLTLDGVTFRLSAESDINVKHGDYESEVMATTGEGLRIMTKRPQIADGVDVIADASEVVLLTALSNRTDKYPLAYKDAASVLWTNEGGISIDDSSAKEGKVVIKILPLNSWEPFA